MIPKREWRIIGLYFTEDEQTREEFRDIMFSKYMDQTDGDMQEALALMAWRLQQAQSQESYEECAIIKDILDEFEYLSR